MNSPPVSDCDSTSLSNSSWTDSELRVLQNHIEGTQEGSPEKALCTNHPSKQGLSTADKGVSITESGDVKIKIEPDYEFNCKRVIIKSVELSDKNVATEMSSKTNSKSKSPSQVQIGNVDYQIYYQTEAKQPNKTESNRSVQICVNPKSSEHNKNTKNMSDTRGKCNCQNVENKCCNQRCDCQNGTTVTIQIKSPCPCNSSGNRGSEGPSKSKLPKPATNDKNKGTQIASGTDITGPNKNDFHKGTQGASGTSILEPPRSKEDKSMHVPSRTDIGETGKNDKNTDTRDSSGTRISNVNNNDSDRDSDSEESRTTSLSDVNKNGKDKGSQLASDTDTAGSNKDPGDKDSPVVDGKQESHKNEDTEETEDGEMCCVCDDFCICEDEGCNCNTNTIIFPQYRGDSKKESSKEYLVLIKELLKSKNRTKPDKSPSDLVNQLAEQGREINELKALLLKSLAK